MNNIKLIYPYKKMRWSAFVFFIIFIVPGFFLFPEGTKVLTITNAIDLTLRNNHDISIYKNNILSKKSFLSYKKKSFLPDLNLSLNYSHNKTKTPDSTGELINSNYKNMDLRLIATRTLFDGFRNVAERKQADFMYKGSVYTFSRAEQTAVYKTILNYLNAILAKEMIEVGKENIKTQKVLLARIEDFFNVGKKAAADVHYQKAEIAESEYQLLNFKKGLELAKAKLLEGIGITSFTGFEIRTPKIEDFKKYKKMNAKEMYEEAKKFRSDLKAAQSGIDASKQAVRSAKSGYYPNISLFGSLTTGFTELNNNYSLTDQFWDLNPSISAGISVSFPIFNRGSTKNFVTQSKLDLENKKTDLSRINNRVFSEIIQADSNFRIAFKQIDAANAKFDYSKIALESLTERYNVNAATISELSLARSQYLQSGYDQINGKLNLFRQVITLLYQIGDIEGLLSVIR
ncbi:MAG: TolC family protein [Acidobacteriota bacterium]